MEEMRNQRVNEIEMASGNIDDKYGMVTTPKAWLDKAFSLDIRDKCRLLWTEKNPFYDAVIKVSKQGDDNVNLDNEFKVHKLILGMGSRKFATQLYDEPLQESSVVDIPFIIEVQILCPTIMKLVLEFLYTDQIPYAGLDWREFGGLFYASKQLGIPQLSEVCRKWFENQRTCEEILDVFQQITALTTKDCVWPKQYYEGLMILCCEYILRNGEVILRAQNFTQLSIENVASIISSDFLVCDDETTVYDALKKWAKHKCKQQGIDHKDSRNCRAVLKLDGDDEDEPGILRHVRFPLMDSLTFTLKVHKSSNALISDKLAETVYEYFTISESQDLFSEKKRYTEAEINANAEDFEGHVEDLVTHLLSHISNTSESFQSQIDEGQGTQGLGSGPCGNSTKTGEQFRESSNDPCGKNSSATNAKAEVNKEEGAIIIKVKSTSDEENCKQIDSVETKSPSIHNPKVRKIPLGYNNRTSVDAASLMLKRKVKMEEELMTPIKLHKREEGNAQTPSRVRKREKEGIQTPRRVHNRWKEDTKTSVKGIKEDTQTPIEISKIEIKPVLTSNQHDSLSSLPGSQMEMDAYIRKNEKIKYMNVIEDCAKRPHITKILLDNVEIDELSEIENRISSLCLPKVTEFVLKANTGKLKKEKSHFQYLMTVNLEQFVFFYRYDESFKTRLNNFWVSGINAKLTFNGVTVLEVKRPKLTINYTQKSSFFNLKSQFLTNIEALNIGNCTIDQNHWLDGKHRRTLVELRLISVKGLKYNQMLQECLSLETLSFWSVETQLPTLSLNNLISEKLRRLSIFGHIVKFNTLSNRTFLAVNELCLCECTSDPSFNENIHEIFPNLKKIYIINRFTSPGPDLLNAIMSMSSIEEVLVWNFDVKSLKAKDQYTTLRKLMSSLSNFTKNEISFSIKRKSFDKSQWQGENITRKYIMKLVYELFGFECFYEFDAWSKYFWEAYDHYY